jgi:hypothetical protein
MTISDDRQPVPAWNADDDMARRASRGQHAVSDRPAAAIWNAGDAMNAWPHRAEAFAWLCEHGLTSGERGHPRSHASRVEFCEDGLCARVFRYAKNAEGSRHLDHPGGTVQLDPPEDMPLPELPPGHLMTDVPARTPG